MGFADMNRDWTLNVFSLKVRAADCYEPGNIQGETILTENNWKKNKTITTETTNITITTKR